MTKPKIANGNCINPLSRLEKRFDEYKRCHQAASKNCNKIQESHNKSNDALKALLERKSKLSDSKIKKKRSAATTAINRKKAKPNPEQQQTVGGFFDSHVETTPNVTLNVNSSEIPDIDWDSFDILNNPNFSMNINEQDLEGVLNSCYTQPLPPADIIKSTQNSVELNALNVCKTSPNTQKSADSLFFQSNPNSFKPDDTIFQPLFPPPENHAIAPCPQQQQQQQSIKFEYLSPPNYLSATTCNYNNNNNLNTPSINQLEPQSVGPFNSHNPLYSMNLPAANSSLSYQYHSNSTLIPEHHQISANGTANTQYFYQYPTIYNSSADHSSNNTVDSFQLPAMSTGWYNNNNSVPTQNMKTVPTNIKQPMTAQQQQQQQFANPSIAIGNYRTNYGQYQMTQQQQQQQHQEPSSTQIQQYQQMFANPQNLVHQTQNYEPPLYTMIPEQQQQLQQQQIPSQQYYYMDYPSNSTRTAAIPNTTTNNFNLNNNRNIIGQTDPRFLNHQTNQILCRNVYQ